MHEKKEVFHVGGQDLVCYSNPGKIDCTCHSQRDIRAYAWMQQVGNRITSLSLSSAALHVDRGGFMLL